MKIEYSEPVSACYFTLKCFPMQDHRQNILRCETELFPSVPFSTGHDGFGNTQIYGRVRTPHSLFSVRVTGKIALSPAADQAAVQEEETYIYRNPHGLNRAGDTIRAYHAALCGLLPEDPLEKALFLMHRLHHDFTYEKGRTDIDTPAEAAFSQGAGVCQDYAHIFIALCRLSGIPVRYVTGLLVGEGKSHAWVEILNRGRWIGLDVTNGTPAADSHIKFCHGRDAADCRMNTGIVYGTARQTMSVTAVTELLEQ